MKNFRLRNRGRWLEGSAEGVEAGSIDSRSVIGSLSRSHFSVPAWERALEYPQGPGCGRRSGLGHSGFECRVQHLDFSLLAQVGEPIVEEDIHLLLEQDLLNTRGHLLQFGDRLAGSVLRQKCGAVIILNLLRGDANARLKRCSMKRRIWSR